MTHRHRDPNKYLNISFPFDYGRLSTSLINFSHKRAGVIPYFKDEENRPQFILGKDSATGDATDFGGQRKPNETSLKCALREFAEESLSVFPLPEYEDFANSIAIYTDDLLIIFVKFDAQDAYDAMRKFYTFAHSKKCLEVNGLYILSAAATALMLNRKTKIKFYSIIENAMRYAIMPTILENL